jgi:RNA polymerase sigma-70 factor (ECF subfamily)
MNSAPGGSHRRPATEDTQARDREDRELVRQALAGSRDAFDVLFLKYRDRVFRILRGMLRNHEEAMDATQDVFLRVLRALGGFDLEGRFYTWLYRIAVNRGIDYIRKRKVRREQQYDQEYTLPASDTAPTRRFMAPDREAEQKEVREQIEAALDKLSDAHRTIFLLFSEEGLKYEEISDVLEIPIGTVMSRLYHARRKLGELLPAEWDPGGRRRREGRPSEESQ